MKSWGARACAAAILFNTILVGCKLPQGGELLPGSEPGDDIGRSSKAPPADAETPPDSSSEPDSPVPAGPPASSGMGTPPPVNPPPPSPTGYTIQKDISGPGFFSFFNSESFNDPTHGYVDYVALPKDNNGNILPHELAYVDGQTGHAIVTVDSTSKVSATARGRKSVRLSSKNAFTTGLVVIDVHHMPQGSGTWPAFWTVGPNWPNSGEIDLLEGVNDQDANQVTLHTKAGCTQNVVTSDLMSGTYPGSRDCNNNNAYNGCTTGWPIEKTGSINSFGPELNDAGGGVFVFLWSKTSIKAWFWKRSAIPLDILNNLPPDPDKWGKPISYFALGTNCPASYFSEHRLVLNTTFCGDWAGAVYPGGKTVCNNYVRDNPTAFSKAYWDIGFIRLYSIPAK